MSSICWSCRLQLLAKSASRVPLGQQPKVFPSATRAIDRPRTLHHSARQQLPRVKKSLQSSGKRLRDDQFTEHDALAEDGVDQIGHATQQSRRRRAQRPAVRQEPDAAQYATNLEANVRLVRQTFKDSLPEGLLDEDGMRVYERLYGPPSRIVARKELEEGEERHTGQKQAGQDAKLMRETDEGDLEEVRSSAEKEADHAEQPELEVVTGQDGAAAGEVDDQTLLKYGEAVRQQAMDESKLTPQQRSILDNNAVSDAFDARADEIMLEEEYGEEEEETARDENEDEDDGLDVSPGDEHRVRTHPLTAVGRFCTSPTTIELPKSTFVEPIMREITPVTTRQMRQVAEHIFEGPGLPYSPATPRRSLTMPQKPIPMLASSKHMNDMESFVYAATVMPGVYASILSVLTETRKRLGTAWIRGLMEQDGGPVVLDAGAGGAGVLAWRDLLKAEWEAMHEESAMQGAVQPRSNTPPSGRATVLTASSSLRNRMTSLLDNTSFIPRMPEAVKPDSHEQRKQYDLIIAPHTLWPLERDFMRRIEVDKLWSLLKPDGGVLVLLEKGVPRGFEVVAGARSHLLKRRIADSSSSTPTTSTSNDIYSKDDEDAGGSSATKEPGMIVAPCTNHGPCPMYKYAGVSQARKDWCYFSQRFVRPPFLQHILGAKKRNHDDVEFSYVVVQRGRDLRQDAAQLHNDRGDFGATMPPAQDSQSTDRAFQGYEAHSSTPASTASRDDTLDSDPIGLSSPPAPPPELAPHPLSLPRLILPPLKRKKHIILDVCTPAATLERWTVTKGFSAQAYRDARKSSWGDLWALGARHRMAKRVDLGKQVRQMEEVERRRAAGKKGAGEESGMDVEVDRWRKKEAKKKRRKEGRKKVDLLDV